MLAGVIDLPEPNVFLKAFENWRTEIYFYSNWGGRGVTFSRLTPVNVEIESWDALSDSGEHALVTRISSDG
jgi:hypothetical protein